MAQAVMTWYGQSERTRLARRWSLDLAREIAAGADVLLALREAVRTLADCDLVGVHHWVGVPGHLVGPDDPWELPCVDGLSPQAVERAFHVLPQHPVFGDGGLADRFRCFRLSDEVDLAAFSSSEAFYCHHEQLGTRFAAGLVLGHGDQGLFLGPHRPGHDFSDTEMAALDALAEPLSSAVTFRLALDTAEALTVQDAPG